MFFSIVMPSYQQQPFLGAALASLEKQENSRFEVIVRDGGSTDGSVEFLEQFSSGKSIDISFHSGKDNGQASAVNSGFEQAHGDVFSFLNSDDILFPGALEKVARIFEQNPDVDMVYGRADYIDSQGNFLMPYPVKPWSREALAEACIICQPACFWRKSLFEKTGKFNETLLGTFDYDYWFRAAATANVFFLDETLAGSRCHIEAKTFRYRQILIEECCQVQEKYSGGFASLSNIRELASVQAGSHLKMPLPALVLQSVFYLRYTFHVILSGTRTREFPGLQFWKNFFPSYQGAFKLVKEPLSRIASQ